MPQKPKKRKSTIISLNKQHKNLLKSKYLIDPEFDNLFSEPVIDNKGHMGFDINLHMF